MKWGFLGVWPEIGLVQSVAPVRDQAFLVLVDVSGSGVIWEGAGAWLVIISGEVRVF